MTVRRTVKRPALTGLVQLEDRSVPAVFTATLDPAVDNAAAVAEIVGLFAQANNGDVTNTINLFAGGKYEFNESVSPFDGGTALPVLTTLDTTLTIAGKGATFYRPPGAPSFRFFRAVGNFVPDTNEGPTVRISDMTFDGGNVFDFATGNLIEPDKLAALDGGALRFDNADAFATNVTFVRNTATDDGGAVAFNGSKLYIGGGAFNTATFRDNYAGNNGGAVSGNYRGELIGSTVAFTDATFDSNASLAGGGATHGIVYEFNLFNSEVIANRGATGGVLGATVSATDTLFRGNVGTGADGNAAAVIATGNMLTLIRSTITENASKGAAVVGQAQGLAVEMLNTTVHLNTGESAAVSATQGEVVLSYSTITDNRATDSDVAGVAAEKNIVAIFASVIAGNRVVDTLSPNVDLKTDLVRNSGFNFIGTAPVSFTKSSTDLIGQVGAALNPGLAKLDDYGGPVPTRPPATGSPLLNAAGIPEADRITTDARGLPRVVGGAADIGAFEVQDGETFPVASTPLPPLVPLPPPPPPPPPPTPLTPSTVFAVGPGAAFTSTTTTTVNDPVRGPITTTTTTGGAAVPNEVRLYDGTGTVQLTVTPFDTAITGGVRVATADVNGDGTADIIAATGPGTSNLVRVFDGETGSQLFQFAPFEASFVGGLFVATGDINGDGAPEIVVSPDVGGGPRVRVYTGGAAPTVIADFFGIDDPNFRGGARVAVGDITGDGFWDLTVAAGTGGGPRVAVWSGASLSGGTFTSRVVPDFFLFDETLRDGLFVAAGDTNADGRADLVVGAGPGGGPRVTVYSGIALADGNGQLTPLANFFTGDPNRRDGVPTGIADLDGDGRADVLAGGGETGIVTVYLGRNLTASSVGTPDRSLTPFDGFAGGVFVG